MVSAASSSKLRKPTKQRGTFTVKPAAKTSPSPPPSSRDSAESRFSRTPPPPKRGGKAPARGAALPSRLKKQLPVDSNGRRVIPSASAGTGKKKKKKTPGKIGTPTKNKWEGCYRVEPAERGGECEFDWCENGRPHLHCLVRRSLPGWLVRRRGVPEGGVAHRAPAPWVPVRIGCRRSVPGSHLILW